MASLHQETGEHFDCQSPGLCNSQLSAEWDSPGMLSQQLPSFTSSTDWSNTTASSTHLEDGMGVGGGGVGLGVMLRWFLLPLANISRICSGDVGWDRTDTENAPPMRHLDTPVSAAPGTRAEASCSSAGSVTTWGNICCQPGVVQVAPWDPHTPCVLRTGERGGKGSFLQQPLCQESLPGWAGMRQSLSPSLLPFRAVFLPVSASSMQQRQRSCQTSTAMMWSLPLNLPRTSL